MKQYEAEDRRPSAIHIGLKADGKGRVAGWQYLQKFHQLLLRYLSKAPESAKEEVPPRPIKNRLQQISTKLKRAQEECAEEELEESRMEE